MPFTIRSLRRVPVYCPVTYETGLFEGCGTVWNLSLTGWRLSGDMPLQLGEVCSLTVNLSIDQTDYVAHRRHLFYLQLEECEFRFNYCRENLSMSCWTCSETIPYSSLDHLQFTRIFQESVVVSFDIHLR